MPLSQFQLFSKPNLFIIFMASRRRNNETQQLPLRREAAHKGAASGTKGWKIQAEKDAFNKGQVLEAEVTDGDLKRAKWRRNDSLMDLIVNSVRKQNIRLITRHFRGRAATLGSRPHLDRNIWTPFVSQLCLIHQHDGVLQSGHPGLCTTQGTGGRTLARLVDQDRIRRVLRE